MVAPLALAASLFAHGCGGEPAPTFDPNDAYYRYGPVLSKSQRAHRIELEPIETAVPGGDGPIKRDVLVERVFLVCSPGGDWPETEPVPRVSLHRPGDGADARHDLTPTAPRGDRVAYEPERGPAATDYALVELDAAGLGACEALVFGARGRLTPLPAPPPEPADDQKDDEKTEDAKPGGATG